MNWKACCAVLSLGFWTFVLFVELRIDVYVCVHFIVATYNAYRLIFYINFSDDDNIAFKPLVSQYLFFHLSNYCTKCFHMTSNIQFARCIALGLLAVATPVCTKSIMFDTTGLQRRLLVQVICIFL